MKLEDWKKARWEPGSNQNIGLTPARKVSFSMKSFIKICPRTQFCYSISSKITRGYIQKGRFFSNTIHLNFVTKWLFITKKERSP